MSNVYIGNVILTKDPDINLLTLTNHNSYVVRLPIVVDNGFTPLCVIIDGKLLNCIVV